MESLAFLESDAVDDMNIITEAILTPFRDKLIQLNVKDPSIDRIQTYRQLESWVDPLLDAGANPKIDNGHRVSVIDVLSIVFNRLVGIHRTFSYDIQLMTEEDEQKGKKFLSLFRDYFDQATPPLLKSLKDCLTAFVAFGTHKWGYEDCRHLSDPIAREIFEGSLHIGFRKGDIYLTEFLLKKNWLAMTTFFPLEREDDISPNVLDLNVVFKSMDNRMLAPSIGRLVSALLRRLQSDLARGTPKVTNLKKYWLGYFGEALGTALLSTDEQVALNTELYVIPGVFHDDKDGFSLFIQHLLERIGESRDCHALTAIVGCLKTGKESGWLTEVQVDEYINALGGYSDLLTSQSGFLRALTLRLMILSSSMALAFPSWYISLFKAHLDDFFAESDAQIRNEVYSGLRALLERIVASSYAVNKRLQSLESRSKIAGADVSPEKGTLSGQLASQKAFTSWFLNELLPAQLRPNSSYQRVILALRVYSFWLPQIDRDPVNSSGSNTNGLSSDVKLSRKRQVEKEHVILPFDPEVQYSNLLRLLVERIIDPYDDIRALASALVKQLRQSENVPWAYILQRTQKLIEDSGRPGQEDGFSHILEVLHHLSLRDPSIGNEVWAMYSGESARQATIVDLAFLLLDRDRHVACKSQSNHPSPIDNSVLGALAIIYKRKDASTLLEISDSQHKKSIDIVLEICQSIWAREREILCNESPEGRGIALSGAISGEDSEDEEDQLSSQGFLSYSWRVVSEASSLLGTVAKYALKAYDSMEDSDRFFESSGELLIEQLTSIRHRGSLSAIFPALTAICFQCLTSSSTIAQNLPHIWLERLLNVISTSGKSITRRSAGLPMALGAILISEIQTKRNLSIFLKTAFESLQNTVRTSPVVETPSNDLLELPQVHALNCMRFLFMDSQLSGVVDPYAADSLSIAFGCFKSNIWAIRNCGIMLYTAIVNRVFPKDGSTQTLRSDKFFQRYSGLDKVFLETLSSGFNNLNDHRLIESVYPALDIISRLTFVETDSPADTSITEEFNDLVIRYIGCKIWKIREAAAKSILAFTPSLEHALGLLRYFLEWNFARGPRDNNAIHGGLCAAREIYEQRLMEANAGFQQKARALVSDVTELYLEPNNKVSPANQALFIQLSSIVFANYPETLNDEVLRFCERILSESKGSPPKTFAHSLLHKEIAKVMALVSPETACGYLSFDDPDYGVSLSDALTKLGKNINLHKAMGELRAGSMSDSGDTFEGELWEQARDTTPFNLLQNILNYHEWEQYRVAATNILLLSSHFEAFNPAGLTLLVTEGPTEPLRESSLVLLGRNLHPVSNDELFGPELGELIQVWMEQLFKSVQDEQPYSTRVAALKSVEAAHVMIAHGVSSTTGQPSSDDLLPVFIVLHKLLNDDEDDIRIQAAALAGLYLSSDASDIVSTTSLQAERKLFKYLASMNAWTSPKIQEILLQDILGVQLQNVKDIKEQLITANTPNTLLFKIEKQNLYRDELRCMQYYLDLLFRATKGQISTVCLDHLTTYITIGMETLWEIAQEYQATPAANGGVSLNAGKLSAADGIMGWTTATEEIFVWGMRIANAFRLLMRWDPERAKRGGVKGTVGRFVEYGEREDVKINKTWLDAFRKGLKGSDSG
ncbi:hypothetical protein ABW19_dt0200342 [Dactylella cylindrospora]|nr:hypothetical protein ABW19_dt0200342 [Dactylella cylindrospora]